MTQYRWRAEYPQEPESVHNQVLRTLGTLEARENEGNEKNRTGKGMEQRMAHGTEQVLNQRNGRRMACGGNRRVRPARLAAVLAAALLCTVTVYAAVHYHLPDLLGNRIDKEKAEALIQTEPQVIQPETLHVSKAVKEQGMEEAAAERPVIPDSSPLLDIRETLFDGARLYIYAAVTENGKNYELNADRLYVNDAEVGPVSTAHLYPGMESYGKAVEEECYTFEAELRADNGNSEDMGNLCAEDSFEVTLPLSVYGRAKNSAGSTAETQALEEGEQTPTNAQSPIRYQNQDLTFTVDVPEGVQAFGNRTFENQTFAYDGFTLEVSDIQLAADSLWAVFYYKMTPKQLAAYQAGEERLGYPLLKNEKGETCTMISAAILEKEDGVRIEAEYSGISAEDNSFLADTGLYNRFQERRSVGETWVKLAETTANEPRVMRTLECENGALEVDAAVDCPEDSAYRGTVKLVPFTDDVLGKLYGTPENWKENESQQDVGCIHWSYEEDGMSADSAVRGSVGEQGQSMGFEMELRSQEEYGSVRERMRVFTPEQAVETLGIHADVLAILQAGGEDHQFYYICGKVKNCRVMWDSPVTSKGTASLEYGDITAVQFEGNYEVTEEEPVELLSIDQVLDQAEIYAEAGQIKRQMSGAAICEIELQYYLEEQEGAVTFRPVWTFRAAEMAKDVPPSTEEGCDIFSIDAVSGELLGYKGMDAPR